MQYTVQTNLQRSQFIENNHTTDFIGYGLLFEWQFEDSFKDAEKKRKELDCQQVVHST